MPNVIEQMQESSVLEEGDEALSKVDEFIQELPWEETRSLLAEVRSSEDFRYAADIARRFVGQDAQTVGELRESVAGYLFETFTYLYLRKRFVNENKVLLSPKETFEVYYQLQPTREKVSGKYGLQKGIDGISVPDGIVLTPLRHLNTLRVDGVCEYMLSTTDKNGNPRTKLTHIPELFRDKIRPLINPGSAESIGIRGYIHSKYSNLPKDLSVNRDIYAFVVLPLGRKIPYAIQGVKEISVPLSTATFGRFMDAFMSDIQIRSPSS